MGKVPLSYVGLHLAVPSCFDKNTTAVLNCISHWLCAGHVFCPSYGPECCVVVSVQ